MKKTLTIVLIIALLLIPASILLYKLNFFDSIFGSSESSDSYKNATYEIEGQPVNFVNGVAEEEATPGSAAMITTSYLGYEAFGELNDDGKDDTAFILTQISGGTGEMFYITAALNEEKEYQGLNAVFLGDRIAPQGVEISDQVITVNYMDRKTGEPMSATPSVGVTRKFKLVEGRLSEIAPELTDKTWTWLVTQTDRGVNITPNKMDAFTLTFKDDGTVNGTTDCNSFSGSYTIEGENLTFGPMASTKMFCQGSQETIFLQMLGRTSSYFYDEDNRIVLLPKTGTAFMIFE